MIKTVAVSILIWCVLICIMAYEEFASESEMQDGIKWKLAVWIAFVLYPFVLPAFLVYRVSIGSVKMLFSALKRVFKVGSSYKYNGNVFLMQERYNKSKRRHNKNEFNHYGRD